MRAANLYMAPKPENSPKAEATVETAAATRLRSAQLGA